MYTDHEIRPLCFSDGSEHIEGNAVPHHLIQAMPKRTSILFREALGNERGTNRAHQVPVPSTLAFRHEALRLRRFDDTPRIQAALAVRIDRPCPANSVPASAASELALGKLHLDADGPADAVFTNNLKEDVDLGRLSAFAEPLWHTARAVLEPDDNVVGIDDASIWQHASKKPIRPRTILGQGCEEVHCEALARIERADPAVLETLNVIPPFLAEKIPRAVRRGEYPRPAHLQLHALCEIIRRRPTDQVTFQSLCEVTS
jgi:hypothetical protein